MLHWNLAEVLQIEDNSTDNLSGFSSSNFDENPSINSENDLNNDQVPSEPFVYVYDEIAKAYCCCTCSYRSTSKQQITWHLMTHSGVKPFKCQFCEYSCTRKDNLKTHLLTHTGERPFVCKICSSAFARKDALKYHMTTHQKAKSNKF